MSSVHDHERYEHDVAAYLLGALSELETQAVEQHMEGCAACRDELERLRMAADALPRAVEQVEPPASLKRALMTVVREEASAAAPAGERRGLGARLRERFPRFSTGVRPRIALVSAAFLLIVGIATGYAITQVTSNDNASRTVAAKVDRTRVPQGSASLVIPHGDKNAILRVNGLPEPAGNQVYEVWLMRGSQPMPVSLFNVTSDGSGAAAIPEELHNGDSVLVTREKPGGAPAPTEAPVISARVS